jgi:hypothetical protein
LSHQFRGKAAPRRGQRGGFSQASTRRGITLYDQHDREWTAMVDLKSGMPTGQIVPSFKAPFVPDQQYLGVNPDNTSELYIDYESMLRNRNARLEEYHQNAVKESRHRKLPAPERGNYTPELIQWAGNPPRPIEPIIAAMQGNVYILGPDYAEERGVPYRVDERLERFVVAPTETEKLLEQYDFASEPAKRPSNGDWYRRNASTAPEGERIGITDAGSAALETDPATDLEDEEETEEMELEGFGDDTETSDLEKNLDELDEQFDSEALGGRTVAPKNQDRAARQAPRRGNASAVRAKHGKSRSQSGQSKSQREGRPTLADGVAPVVGDDAL